MNLSIREAGIDDLDILNTLNREVQELHHKIDPQLFKSADKSDIREDVKKLIMNPQGGVLIAFESDKAQGFVSYGERLFPESGLIHTTRMLFIHHMGVQEAFRAKGIGSALIQSLQKIADRRKIKHIQLNVWTLNLDAKRFFQKRGFRTINEIMICNR